MRLPAIFRDRAAARALLGPLCLFWAAAAALLAYAGVLQFVVGAFALVGFPATYLILACYPLALWRAAAGRFEAIVCAVLGLAPLLAFAEIMFGQRYLWRILPKTPHLVNVANIDPPSQTGYEFIFIAAYAAALTGALWLRLRIWPPQQRDG